MSTVNVTNGKTEFDADTNPVIPVEMGAGAVTANTQRVVLASDGNQATAANQVSEIAYLDAFDGYMASFDTDLGTISTRTTALASASEGFSSKFRHIDLDETKREVSAVACSVGWYYFKNRSASEIFIKIWDLPQASVTVGTTAPSFTIPIPPGSAANSDAPIKFTNGMTIACTTGIADADTTGPGANECIVNIAYR